MEEDISLDRHSSGLVPESLLSEIIRKNDIIIFNQGLYYEKYTMIHCGIQFIKMGKLLKESTQNTTKQLIIRSTTPEHYPGGQSAGIVTARVCEKAMFSCVSVCLSMCLSVCVSVCSGYNF